MPLPIVPVTPVWSQPENRDFTGQFTLQNINSGCSLYVLATADDTPPAQDARGMLLPPRAMLPGFTLAELFPHIPNARRIWLRADINGSAYFSHAA